MHSTGRSRFPPGKHTMPHRFVNGHGRLSFQWNQPIQRRVRALLTLLEGLLQHVAEYNKATGHFNRESVIPEIIGGTWIASS
jgi:hypothetical protein